MENKEELETRKKELLETILRRDWGVTDQWFSHQLEQIESLADKQGYMRAKAEDEKIVDEYGKSMSKLHKEMIATAHEDSKRMLAYDMYSRLIAVRHIKKKFSQAHDAISKLKEI